MSDFHSEWRTIGDNHRVNVKVRDGFPFFILWEIVEQCIRMHTTPDSNVIQLFYDDTNGDITVLIATDNPSDISNEWTGIIQEYGGYQFHTEIEVVPKGNKDSDHYNHACWLWERSERKF